MLLQGCEDMDGKQLGAKPKFPLNSDLDPAKKTQLWLSKACEVVHCSFPL